MDRNTKKDLAEERDYWRDLFFKHKEEYENAKGEQYLLQISKLKVKPGETVVMSAPAITAETARRLKDQFEKRFPGIKAIVVCDGLKIEKQRCTNSSP